MNPWLVLLWISAVVVLITGAIMVLSVRANKSRRRNIKDGDTSDPSQVSDLVEVLQASAAGGALVDKNLAVIASNEPARRMELLQGGDFTFPALQRLCQEARRTGAVQRITIEVPRNTIRGRGGLATMVLEARRSEERRVGIERREWS